ncbi:dTMP kinase [Ureaplasma miroungigenitalium]|uniref:Thymidylate kinase n=1 Tax=Ureaplasma miroungigenitalium TaxID=1042321 RepID=A0ABT3BN50_9BACT|nr:dTMP kinase [Ureaplasma miroungigenitalium]MCV3728457.1 dTMP kinase [Ureaplasma miroungigenitalium]MCV3734244.1 dTMP kinase [Ureaplasma miroungigenitalium]
MPKIKQQPLFIVFEGIDGAGKTTIIEQLKIKLAQDQLIDAFIFTREPGGYNNQTCETIRSFTHQNLAFFDNLTLAYLYAASRNEHLLKTIKPALAEQKIIICDRFVHSSLVYQSDARTSMQKVHDVNKITINDFRADYIFYFKADAKKAMERIALGNQKNRELNFYDQQKSDFYDSLIEKYDHAFAQYFQPKNRHIIIDANQNIDDVFQETYDQLMAILKV